MKLEQRPDKDEEQFRAFIRKNEDHLTPDDAKALEGMQDKPTYAEEDSELKFIRGNHSFIRPIEETDDFYRMKEEDEKRVEGYSRKQVFVTQLAANLIPVAPIGTKNGKFYAKLVQKHEGFSAMAEKNTPLFALVAIVLFRDIDKPGFDRPNILGGVSFDFDYSSFAEQDAPSYLPNLKKVLAHLHHIDTKDISLMLQLVENFEHQLSGEEGIQFLDRNRAISGYTVVQTEQLQRVLLARIKELRSYLAKELLRDSL